MAHLRSRFGHLVARNGHLSTICCTCGSGSGSPCVSCQVTADAWSVSYAGFTQCTGICYNVYAGHEGDALYSIQFEGSAADFDICMAQYPNAASCAFEGVLDLPLTYTVWQGTRCGVFYPIPFQTGFVRATSYLYFSGFQDVWQLYLNLDCVQTGGTDTDHTPVAFTGGMYGFHAGGGYRDNTFTTTDYNCNNAEGTWANDYYGTSHPEWWLCEPPFTGDYPSYPKGTQVPFKLLVDGTATLTAQYGTGC